MLQTGSFIKSKQYQVSMKSTLGPGKRQEETTE